MKPYTASEYNISHIKKILKQIKEGTVSVKDSGLNARFDRLQKENIGMYEELYPKYISTVRSLKMEPQEWD